MPQSKQLVAPRKEPSQERARQTVDAILQAASLVVSRDGYDKASTNRIAQEAGVSIGSLYQYFPNKEAVIHALVERHEERMHNVIRQHLGDISGRDLPTLVRSLIVALIEAHRITPRLQKVLLEHAGVGRTTAVDEAVLTLVRAAMHSRRDELALQDLDVAAFILVTAVRTSCHRAVVERQDLLERPSFVDELASLVLRYALK